MSTALIWFRCDLRLADNAALHSAIAHHDTLVPVFIYAPEEEGDWPLGGASRWWLHHSLAALGESLTKAGAPLLLRKGASLKSLRELVKETGAEALYFNRCYEPVLAKRDAKIIAALATDGLEVESFPGALLFEPQALKTAAGEPFKVFSPFWKTLQRELTATIDGGRQPLPAPRSLRGMTQPPKSLALADLALLPRIGWDAGFAEVWAPGERGAARQLQRFCERAATGYDQDRNLPSIEGSSRLSPHLHFGEISPLQMTVKMQRWMAASHAAGSQRSGEAYLRELAWRDFAFQLLHFNPETPKQPLNPRFAHFPWRKKPDYAADLSAWQRGQTGVPLIDAGMRQLWTTGWMHNRVRMVVASFLIKNLLIPWQEGEAWFWDTLVDADLPNNTMNWQWVAGCGADAAPYFRIFNPALQSKKFEAGDYIHRWVPELVKLRGEALHAPWLDENAATAAGIVPGQDYPRPIVELMASRDRALAVFRNL